LTRAEQVGGYCATLLVRLPFHSEWVVECESSKSWRPKQWPRCCGTTDHNRRAVLQQRDCHRRLVRPDAADVRATAWRAILNSAWRWRLAEVPESALDDVPLTWVTTPAREMGQSLAECILRRLEKGQMSARNQIAPAAGDENGPSKGQIARFPTAARQRHLLPAGFTGFSAGWRKPAFRRTHPAAFSARSG
jgi:LacI family transcriptional regulator of maltose regulon